MFSVCIGIFNVITMSHNTFSLDSIAPSRSTYGGYYNFSGRTRVWLEKIDACERPWPKQHDVIVHDAQL